MHIFSLATGVIRQVWSRLNILGWTQKAKMSHPAVAVAIFAASSAGHPPPPLNVNQNAVRPRHWHSALVEHCVIWDTNLNSLSNFPLQSTWFWSNIYVTDTWFIPAQVKKILWPGDQDGDYRDYPRTMHTPTFKPHMWYFSTYPHFMPTPQMLKFWLKKCALYIWVFTVFYLFFIFYFLRKGWVYKSEASLTQRTSLHPTPPAE